MHGSAAASPSNQLDISVAWDDDGCVLAVGGELDMATEALFGDAVSAALEVTDDLTVDLERVRFADCVGVAVLTRSARTAARAGKHLTVRNCPPSVYGETTR